MNKIKQILPYIGAILGGIVAIGIFLSCIFIIVPRAIKIPLENWLSAILFSVSIIGLWLFIVWSVKELINRKGS